MRKIFRMKYEPCNGRCYAPDEVLNIKEFSMPLMDAAVLLDRIIKIHEPACGNDNLSYGMDYDEVSGVFIASFIHFGELDLFTSRSGLECMNSLIDGALSWYESDTAKEKLSSNPGVSHSACQHGEDYDLRRFALRFSGLDQSEIDDLLLAH